MIKQLPNTRPSTGSNPDWRPLARTGWLMSFFLTQRWFKSFKAQTFDPPRPLKCRFQFQGDRGLKIKKSIGGSFCRAK